MDVGSLPVRAAPFRPNQKSSATVWELSGRGFEPGVRESAILEIPRGRKNMNSTPNGMLWIRSGKKIVDPHRTFARIPG